MGHEIDFTISDFAADFRAPTPSAAAEILSSDSAEILEQLAHLTARLRRPVHARLDSLKNQLAAFERTALFLEPPRRLREACQTLDRLSDDLDSAVDSAIQNSRLALERHTHFLASQNPERKITELLRQLSTDRALMDRLAQSRVRELQTALASRAALLEALNPNAAIARGYTITMDSQGRILRNSADALAADFLETKFANGTVRSRPERASGQA
ncbi:MAG: exodeoxyribonuclease VII large subunit [Spartobacteria bacterium]